MSDLELGYCPICGSDELVGDGWDEYSCPECGVFNMEVQFYDPYKHS